MPKPLKTNSKPLLFPRRGASTPSQSTKRGTLARITVSLVLLAGAIYVLLAHWKTVTNSLQLARGASIPWLALSLVLMCFTFCIAAGIYGVLALHRLRYRETVLVEVSTAFVNRLLPSGLGGLGLHGVYLYKRKHTVAEATVVVSLNNLLGMAAHFLLLACVGLFYSKAFRELSSGKHPSVSGRIIVATLLVAIVVLALPAVRRRITHFVANLLASVRKLSLRSVAKALFLAMLLTTTYTLLLLSTARSVGVHLGLLQIFIVFSIGMLTSTATPTPGGLVGAEAGLFAGFVAYGVASPAAGAAVLLYRLVTYWIPLVPGLAALAVARRKRLV